MSKKAVSLSILLAAISTCVPTRLQAVEPISISSPPLEERVPVQYKEGVHRAMEVRQFAIDYLGFYKDSKHYTWFAEEGNNGHTLSTLLVTEKTTLPPSGKVTIEHLDRNGAYRETLDSSLYLYSEEDQLTDERDYYAREGFDTYWRSVTSYHTFGEGMGSPITPSFLNSGLVYQAQTIIHEMCHEFVEKNIGADFSSELNESFCNLAGYAGVVEYFTQKNMPEERADALNKLDNHLEFARKFNKAHGKISEVYNEDISRKEKIKQRQQLFSEIQSFMGADVNNALMWSWYPYLVHFPLMNDAYAAQGCNLNKFMTTMKDCPEDEEKALEYIREISKP